jgi:cytochrome c-type biogenesis protein CcmE
MTRKRRRLYLVLACAVGLGGAATLTFRALSSNLEFFIAPTELVTHPPATGRSFRLGGLVQPGSVTRRDENGRPVAYFRATDGKNTVPVSFAGILPALFAEGQWMIALGSMRADGTFLASEVLAKHDENYMPRDIAEALKKSGHWNETGPPPAAATWNAMPEPRPGG